MNYNKNCAQEIRQVKVPQLALHPTGPRPRLKSPNCRYTTAGTPILSSRIITETNRTAFSTFFVVKVKIKKCEAFRDSVKLLGTNGIFQRKLLSLKGSHYCIVKFYFLRFRLWSIRYSGKVLNYGKDIIKMFYLFITTFCRKGANDTVFEAVRNSQIYTNFLRPYIFFFCRNQKFPDQKHSCS